ncbi:hypothetical protein BT96DRAFT_265397 [Gymnopus androsaceus JB14]|uniref:Uncharacterized protein n=1 Tax=Gymnopus androsaceus JB14 TaxID=1447944 RepID=A0A6A4H650_9AGAR|nr:hypothetical protein BT96DRAFT_265397 [Gymnopus androsaceus JB14]
MTSTDIASLFAELPENRKREGTPPIDNVDNNAQPRSEVESTPNSQHNASYSSAITYGIKPKTRVEDANLHLRGDLESMRTLPAKEWALTIFGEVPAKDVSTISEEVEAKLNRYLDQTNRQCKEPELYPSLVALLNKIGSDGSDKVFYTQDPVPVRGSFVSQKPDIGMLFKALAVDENNMLKILSAKQKKMGRVFYALLLAIVEAKHRKGELLGAKYKRESSFFLGST